MKIDRYILERLINIKTELGKLMEYIEKRKKRGRPTKVDDEIVDGLLGLGGIGDIAKAMGVSSSTIYYKLKKKRQKHSKRKATRS